ncbi:MAG: phage tail assembly protein [Cyanobacteria bacterium J06633_8]
MDIANSLHTEFDFILPKGLVDSQGQVHRKGVMRLTTAKDEICVKKDRLVQKEPEYGVLVMLSRVITRLGTISSITPELIENLFCRDLAYLREFYNRINQEENTHIPVQCPQCSHQFNKELSFSGES